MLTSTTTKNYSSHRVCRKTKYKKNADLALKNNGLKQADKRKNEFVSPSSMDNSDSVIDALQKALNVIQAANISGNYSSDGEEEWSD